MDDIICETDNCVVWHSLVKQDLTFHFCKVCAQAYNINCIYTLYQGSFTQTCLFTLCISRTLTYLETAIMSGFFVCLLLVVVVVFYFGLRNCWENARSFQLRGYLLLWVTPPNATSWPLAARGVVRSLYARGS